MFDKFAEELKTAREKIGLTIQQVAAKSRIDIKFLEAMEIGDFSFLPELYVKAFVKDYSNIVGLDPVLMLKKFEAARHGNYYLEESEDANTSESETPDKNYEPAPVTQKEELQMEKPVLQATPNTTSFDGIIEDNQSASKTNDSSMKNIRLGIFVAAIFILAFLVYLIFFKQSNEIIVNDKPAEQVVTENNQNKQRYVEETPPVNAMNDDSSSAVNNKIGMAVDSLLLSIKAVDTSWVKILVDDTLDEEFILFPQSQKNIKAGTNYKIAFGRAKSITLELNQKPLKFSPRTEVSYILINNDGLQYLTRSEYMGSH